MRVLGVGLLLISVALALNSSSPIFTPPSVDGMIKHLQQFEQAAMANSGSRSIAKGYNASAEYVLQQLEYMRGVYSVTTQHFVVPVYTEIDEPELTIVGADPALSLSRCKTRTGWQHYESGCDYSGVRYGGNGKYDILAHTTYIVDPCSKASFEGFPKGNAAVMEVSSLCDYYVSVVNAEEAGASAVLLASRPGTAGLPGSRVFDSATWKEGTYLPHIPTVGISAALGTLLRQEVIGEKPPHAPAFHSVRIVTNAKIELFHTYNILAQTHVGTANDVVMVGAHLDSVPEGPGINDNGSGSALILQLAMELSHKITELLRVGKIPSSFPAIRFAWWGAEEIGLMGSRYYVDDLVHNKPHELDDLRCYLNFDMEAGPNYIRMIYDGSTAPEEAREGSKKLQLLFEDAWSRQRLNWGLTPMGGGSDFLPFILAGVPASGLATGAGGLKSKEERAAHGGIANAPLDPCYHSPCDTVDNVNRDCIRECGTALSDVLNHLVEADKATVRNALRRSKEDQQASYLKALNSAKGGFHQTCGANDEL